MAYNHNQAGPFWDFVRSLSGPQYQGEGVDHSAGEHQPFGGTHAPPPPPPPPPHGPGAHGPHGPGPHGPATQGPGVFAFGPWGFGAGAEAGFFGGPGARGGWGGRGRGWGHGMGHHGRHGGRHGGRRGGSRSPSPEDEEGAREEEVRENVEGAPEGEERTHGRGGRRRRDRSHHGRRGREEFGGRRGSGHRGGPGAAPFDLAALLASISEHPIGQALGRFAEQSGLGAQMSGETLNDDSESSFTPPIDVFHTPAAYVLHVALPGAKKEDVGINWDAEKGELNIAGVIYRGGDEEFLKSAGRRERKVGVFERNVKLPPAPEEKEEVDGDAITAKLEDGVLVVTVPKVEKEWTEVKKVDIL